MNEFISSSPAKEGFNTDLYIGSLPKLFLLISVDITMNECVIS